MSKYMFDVYTLKSGQRTREDPRYCKGRIVSEAIKMFTRARTTPHLQRCGNRSTIVMIQVRGAGEYG